MGTAGFEFIEYAAPDPAALRKVFELLGFKAIAKHPQGRDAVSPGRRQLPDQCRAGFFRATFRPSARSVDLCHRFRVQDAAKAYKRALELGAWGFDSHSGPMELNIPAIKGIGDSLIYLVDRWAGKEGHGASATSASMTWTSCRWT